MSRKNPKTEKYRNSHFLTHEQIKYGYERHLQGAYVWSGAVVSIWLFILISYLFKSIDSISFIGVSITAGIFIIIYFPFLWGLKKITRRFFFEVYNLSINFIQAIGDTVIIYYLGGIKGMYLILIYAGLIAFVGVVAPFHYPFIVATVCAVSFGAMALMEHFGFIPHMNNKWGYHYTLSEVILIIIVFTVTIYVLAFILSYTANLLRKIRKKLRLQNKELEKSHLEINKAADALRKKNADLKESMEELRQTQEQLVESEKMAALGGLVAGVAHEINTPVGVSITASSFLLDKTSAMLERISKDKISKEEVKQFLYTVSEASTIIDNNLKRSVELIRHFKQVAVDQSTENLRKFNLKEYIDGTILSLQYHYKRTGHTITVNCPENLVIESYPGAFSQIITNLLMNSLIHGLDDKDNGQIVFNMSSDGRTLHFQYSDNGKGMDKETEKRIFEPFFTTKRGEKSTGLGMHIVYNIVTQTLGGKVQCSSSKGNGAMFDITIPLHGNAGQKNSQSAKSE